MLVVSRKPNEAIEIRPTEGAGCATLEQVFGQGGITISLVRVGNTRVRVAIDAPPQLKIWRRDAVAAEAGPQKHDTDD